MTQTAFLRIKKLTHKDSIFVAAKHNHREIVAENGAAKDGPINPLRIGDNVVLRGQNTAAGVAEMAQSLMNNAEVKPLRKDAVRALEIIFSLPPTSQIDQRQFFDDAIKWLEQYFNVPVISAIIHNDEAAPHCHVLLLPLVCGRMIGSELMGNKAKLQAMQADFHVKVAHGYGFTRQAPHKRLSATIRRQAIDAALTALTARSALDPALLRVLLEPHFNDPASIMLELGLEILTTPAKTRANAASGKSPTAQNKSIGFESSNPIGFDQSKIVASGAIAPFGNHQTLSCVGFCDEAQPMPAFTVTLPEPEPEPIQDDYTRQRDADQPANYWDESQGEFIAPPTKTQRKPKVIAAVNAALSALGTSTRRGGAVSDAP